MCFVLPGGKPISFLCNEYSQDITTLREDFCRGNRDTEPTRCANIVKGLCNNDPFEQGEGLVVGNLCTGDTYDNARLASCADHNIPKAKKDDTCTGANGAINIVETHCIGLPAEDDIYGLCTYNGKATNSNDYLTWRGDDNTGIIGVGRASQDDSDANLIAGSVSGLTLGEKASDLSEQIKLDLGDFGGDSDGWNCHSQCKV